MILARQGIMIYSKKVAPKRFGVAFFFCAYPRMFGFLQDFGLIVAGQKTGSQPDEKRWEIVPANDRMKPKREYGRKSKRKRVERK